MPPGYGDMILPCQNYLRFFFAEPSISDLCAMSSYLRRLLKHHRYDCKSNDFKDIPNVKTRRAQYFVAISEVDVDASKNPIVVKNTEKVTSVFFTVVDFLLASTSASEIATQNAALPVLSCTS